MNNISRKWLEAAIAFANDINAKVKCPVCDIGYLTIIDTSTPNTGRKFDRYMKCDHCGNWNVVQMKL